MRTKLFILIFFLFTFSAFADIYVQEDANGVTKFSDTPSENAERVKLNSRGIITSKPTVTSMPLTTETNPKSQATSLQPSYNIFRLMEPKDQQTFQNQSEITVTVEIEPALEDGDKVQIYVDGQPYGNATPALSHQIQILERGTHRVSAKLLDKNGKTLRETETITIFVHRHSVITAPN